MLDYAAINQVKQGLQANDQRNHQHSADCYSEGRALVREALHDPIDKNKLKQEEFFSGQNSESLQY